MTTAPAHQLPGTWRTYIVVWNIDDAEKRDDPRYWWSADEVGRLLRVTPPEHATTVASAGLPKGRSLSSYRDEFGGGGGRHPSCVRRFRALCPGGRCLGHRVPPRSS